MKNEKTLTPIIVGCVIALLGILTGLYIADNARQTTTDSTAMAATASQDQPEGDIANDTVGTGIMEELPPVEPSEEEDKENPKEGGPVISVVEENAFSPDADIPFEEDTFRELSPEEMDELSRSAE